MKKKRDFVDRLMSYGVGFALFFLTTATLSVSMLIFLGVLALVIFLDQLN